MCLELGLEPLRFIIMRRGLLYLQSILKQKENSLMKKFVKTQFKCLKKKDWGQTIKNDFKTLEINLTLQEIEDMPKSRYKQLIKSKIRYYSWKYLVDKKEERNGKGKEIISTELRIQNYLQSDNLEINNNERKLIFQLRTRMHYNIKSHFRRMYIDSICDGCRKEESNTKHILECNSLLGKNKIVTYLPNYEDLFSNEEEEQAYISRVIKENLRLIQY